MPTCAHTVADTGMDVQGEVSAVVGCGDFPSSCVLGNQLEITILLWPAERFQF